MSSEFKVGEVAVFWEPGDPVHGHDALVTDGLRVRAARVPCATHGHHIHVAAGYRVKIDGKEWSVLPHQLRKKPKSDDSRDIGSWDDVPFFNPTKSKAIH